MPPHELGSSFSWTLETDLQSQGVSFPTNSHGHTTHTRCTLTKITSDRSSETISKFSLCAGMTWHWLTCHFSHWDEIDIGFKQLDLLMIHERWINTVPLLNCCKLWVQWSAHLFKNLCMHLRKLQPIADLCASLDLASPVMQSRIPQFPLHLLDVHCISTLACS
jgi:hypothetical protein